MTGEALHRPTVGKSRPRPLPHPLAAYGSSFAAERSKAALRQLLRNLSYAFISFRPFDYQRQGEAVVRVVGLENVGGTDFKITSG